jgi:hypothetical protein
VNGLAVLLYADARTIVNGWREIRRSPGRSVIWLLWVVLIAGWLVLRSIAPHRNRLAGFDAVARCDLIVCLTIAVFGVFLAHGSSFAGLFANRAEARWIIGSPVSPFVATVYIQMRELVRRGARFAVTYTYLALVVLPDAIAPAVLWRDLLFGILAILAIGAVPLPRRLAHGPAAVACTLAGYALVALALLPLARDAAIALRAGGRAARFLLALPPWHPGLVLLEPPNAESAAIGLGLAVVAGTALAILGAAARDAYPELYTWSCERIDRSARPGLRRFATSETVRAAPGPVSGVDPARVPAGAGVLLWKSWTEYRRRSTPRATAIETAGFLVAGYVAARLIGNAHPSAWFSIASAVGSLLLVFSSGFGLSFAHELRRPLFWLSGTTLFERLSGLLAGHVWRFAGWFVLFTIGLASGGAGVIPVILAGVTGPAMVVLAAAIGYAVFAVFPSEIDLRGPLAMLRVLVSYAFVIPALFAGIVTGVLFQSATFGLFATAIVALLEAAGLIGFAAWRLDASA